MEDDLQNENRVVRNAEVERIDVAAPDGLAEAFQEKGDAERGHEQDDAFLVDQRRSTTRSIANASAIMTTTASSEREPSGRNSISRTSVSAANSTIAPWAKLNTPDALKMSTKPSATSE